MDEKPRKLWQFAEFLLAHPDEWSVDRKFAFVCWLAVIVFCVCVSFILWHGLQ
jgi:hypothetical protein